MVRRATRCSRHGFALAVMIALTVSLVAGCGYMPRTANQMQGQLDARDDALRQEMAANKEELLGRLQQADQCLAGLDTKLADVEKALDDMRQLEVMMQSVRSDMTSVQQDLRSVREGLRGSVRKELGEALSDAGRSLQSGP
jgi:hypothetical protein